MRSQRYRPKWLFTSLAQTDPLPKIAADCREAIRDIRTTSTILRSVNNGVVSDEVLRDLFLRLDENRQKPVFFRQASNPAGPPTIEEQLYTAVVVSLTHRCMVLRTEESEKTE